MTMTTMKTDGLNHDDDIDSKDDVQMMMMIMRTMNDDNINNVDKDVCLGNLKMMMTTTMIRTMMTAISTNDDN